MFKAPKTAHFFYCTLAMCRNLTHRNALFIKSFFSSHLTFSSSPWWLHCVPVVWNGIPTGGLQKSGVLHWQHWNRCCHELDHEPYGRPWCVEQREVCQKENPLSGCLAHSSCSSLCDWLQISLPLWCCQAVALALGPRPQRASLRSTWQPSSPWASVETRQPKHLEPRLESNSLDFAPLVTRRKPATAGSAAPLSTGTEVSLFFAKLPNLHQSQLN